MGEVLPTVPNTLQQFPDLYQWVPLGLHILNYFRLFFYVHMCLCTTYMSGAHEGHKRAFPGHGVTDCC